MTTSDPGASEAVDADLERTARLEEARRRAAASFASAVESERAAIELHEATAARLRSSAEHDRQMAAADTATRDRWLAAAANADERAQAAQERAEHVRARLRAEGVEP